MKTRQKKNGHSSGQKSKMIFSARTKLSAKTIYMAAAFSILLLTGGLIAFINLSSPDKAHAAANGDYRSFTSGTWGTAATWEKYNGSTWAAATVAPSYTDGAIEIQSGHTVTISANVTVDDVLIDAGGQVTVSANTMTIHKGSGVDVTVNGTLDISSTVAFNSNSTLSVTGTEILRSGGTITTASGAGNTIASGGRFRRDGGTIPSNFPTVSSGGIYQHNLDGGTIASATWNTGATCEITGITTTLPSGLGQTFKNLTWNCTSQNTAFDLGATLQNINGNLTLTSTGSSNFQFDAQGNNSTINIGGNLNVQGGTVYSCTNGSTIINLTGNYVQTGGTFAFTKNGGTAYGNTSTVMNVTGNATISGGTLDMSQCDANNSAKGIGQMYLTGNMSLSGSGVVTETSNASSGQVYFNGTSAVQYFTSTSLGCITNSVDFIVNSGAILRMDDQILSGGGNFTLMSNGGLMMGNANGITSSGATGNVQCSGTRSYSTGGDYTYNGIVAQNSGNGLPSTVHNLTINNSSNVTLTSNSSVSNILNFTSGLWIATNDTLTLGTSTAVLGTLSRTTGHVVGYFKRWIAAATTSNILFPIGTLTYYDGANFSFTTAPTAGSILSSFVQTNPGTLGLPLTDAGDNCGYAGYAYWLFGARNGFASGVYTVNLYANGFPGIADYTKLHLFKRTGSGASWTMNGTHAAGTGSNSAPVVNRTGMNILGHYGVVSGIANTLPIELIYFNAKANENQVDFTWATATELNNDYFTVERSTDAANFSEVLRKQGAGNSTVKLYYADADRNPFEGYSYYRLKQTDYDGHFTYSDIKTVKNKAKGEDTEVKISMIAPNPFHEKFRLTFLLKQSVNVKINILNSNGQIVFTDMISTVDGVNEYDFYDASGLPAGIYFIQLSYDNQKVIQKIIKN